ncbi:MAG: carboxyl transferase domain-containing protein [Acutalibacteraceae bacterium]|nr:carboxyl transferase domain-containing protein [Acutalibacteraceae bacterium]
MSTENLSTIKAEIEKSSAYKNLSNLFDEGTFTQIDAYTMSGENPTEVIAGYGTVNSCPVYAFAQNSDICGGAMSKAHSAKLQKVYDLAEKTGTPVIGMYDSVGAKLSEGIDMLGSYGAVLNSVSKLSGVVPQISVVLGNCLGTGALNAVSADFVIMSEKAKLSLDVTGRNSSADNVAKQGISHITVKDTESAIEKAKELITLLPSNNLSVSPVMDADEPAQDAKCPISKIVDADSFVQFKKEYGTQAVIGFGRIAGLVAGFVATKGGVLDADSSNKIASFVRFCDAFAIPIVTLADSEGFSNVTGAAKVTSAYADATTVKATVITGKAYGAFYIAVAGAAANADITFAVKNAVISPLAPVTGAAIMWADKMAVAKAEREKVVAQYEKEECTAFKAAAGGYVNDVILSEDIRFKLYTALEMLAGKRIATMPKKHGTIN